VERGLEAALVDFATINVDGVGGQDVRRVRVKVAGVGALLVAKLHKFGERVSSFRALENKDAHDIYRLLMSTDTCDMTSLLRELLADPLSGNVTFEALAILAEHFATGPQATGSWMAGGAETIVGSPEEVSRTVATLATDLIAAVNSAK
jgi:hypothetical protein